MHLILPSRHSRICTTVITPVVQNIYFKSSIYIAHCSPSCKNGGTCTRPGYCDCTSQWRGHRCEERKYGHNRQKPCSYNIMIKVFGVSTKLDLPAAVCNPPCANGGRCTAPNDCDCTAQWKGARCQTRKFDYITTKL